MAGGSKSQDTTSTTANYDQRQVNTWDTNTYDLSNRSNTNADFSNNSTNTTTITTTDGGAVSGALGVASGVVDGMAKSLDSVIGFANKVTASNDATVAKSYDFADHVFDGAINAVQSTDTRAMNAFDRAATIENDALAMSKDSFSNAMGMVQNAYADAKGTTQAQQKIMIGVLVVAAIAVVAPRLGK